MESSRTSWASRTHFDVFGLEGQVLGLEASSPRKLPCPRSKTAIFFELLKFCRSLKKIFENLFFGDCLKRPFLFFFGEYLRLCPWSWPRAFLFLASRGSVLERAVLGFGLFCVLGLGLEHCVLDFTSAFYKKQY